MSYKQLSKLVIIQKLEKKSVCGHVGCSCNDPLLVSTVPNAITLIRTILSAIVAIVAIVVGNGWLVLLAYIIYWAGDMLDGASSRFLNQETVRGAKMDIICDRINGTLCLIGVATIIPNYVAEGMFFFQFMVIDLILSLIIFRWPILSPNYFYAVDKLVYYLNWHTIAKALNTSLFIILLVAFENPTYAIVASALLLLVKLFSLTRVVQLLRKRDTHQHLAAVPQS